MATYIKRSCPKCQTTLEGWSRPRCHFGAPYVICPKCQAVINQSAHINEWELMSPSQRYTFKAAATWSGLLYGIGGGFMLCAVVSVSGLDGNLINRNPGIIVAVISITLPVAAYWMHGKFAASRAASVSRTKDPVYRKKLAELGYLNSAGKTPSAQGNCPGCGKQKVVRHLRCSCGYDFLLKKLVEKPSPPSLTITDSGMTLSDLLGEQATSAPTMVRVMMDAMELKYQHSFPQVLISPNWSKFRMVATVGGCNCLSILIHSELTEEYRTPTELKLREALELSFPGAEKLFEDCSRFVRSELLEIKRSDRGGAVFLLTAKWVFGVINNGGKMEAHEKIVSMLASIFQRDFPGYWRSNNAV